MTLTSQFDHISPTALLVAHARAFTGIPFTKQIADLLDCQRVVQELLGCADLPEMTVLIESRYRAIEQICDRLGYSQIIEIASGLLPRGMIRTENPDVIFIETDLPQMIAQKRQLQQILIGDRPNLQFLALDITVAEQLPQCHQFLDQKLKLLVLTEGLLMYLSHDQKRQVFANVRTLLELYGGGWVTADFVTTDSLERRRQICPNLSYISQMVSRLSDRPITDTYFQNHQAVQEFINAQGFRCDAIPVASMGLPYLADFPMEVAQKILADAYVYVLELT